MPHGPGGHGGPGGPGGHGGFGGHGGPGGHGGFGGHGYGHGGFGGPGMNGMNSPFVQGAEWGQAFNPPEGGGEQDPISPSDVAPRDYTETEKVIIAIAIIVFVIAAIVAICYAAIIG